MLLLYADVPLLQTTTLSRLIEHHRATKAAATVLTMDLPEPYGYGRIVRDAGGQITRIVEERDASGRAAQDPRSQQRHLLLRSDAAVRARCISWPLTTRKASTT